MTTLDLVTTHAFTTARGRAVYLPTPKAHALLKDPSDASKPVGHATLWHTLSVAEVLWIARRQPHVTVIPEREINRAYAIEAAKMKFRTNERPVPPPEGVWWTRRSLDAKTHKPDLVVEHADGRREFLEVELVSKTAAHLSDILRGFMLAVDEGTLSLVRYIGPVDVIQRVQRTVHKLSTNSRHIAAFRGAVYQPLWDTSTEPRT